MLKIPQQQEDKGRRKVEWLDQFLFLFVCGCVLCTWLCVVVLDVHRCMWKLPFRIREVTWHSFLPVALCDNDGT